MAAKYCPVCGGTGVKLDGTPCGCRMSMELLTSDLVSLDLPEQYQGIKFVKDAVDSGMGSYYADYLLQVYSDVTSMQMKNTNILICSPKATSKSVMAYSAIQELFKKGVQTFPIYDLLEIRRMTVDMDLGRRSQYTMDNPEDILKVPYLFVKFPAFGNNDAFSIMATLIDRRTRRNGCTIILYDGSLTRLKEMDYKHVLDGISKDGSYGTLLCKDFWRKGEHDATGSESVG